MRRWNFHVVTRSNGAVSFCDLVVSGSFNYILRWKQLPTKEEVVQAIGVATAAVEYQRTEKRYRDALYRHLNAIERGELVDDESGESHWAHVATNARSLCGLHKQEAP